jgi:hypothetical protein
MMLPKESDLLRLWKLERELGEAIEIGHVARAEEIEFEIEELMNEVPHHGSRKRSGRHG